MDIPIHGAATVIPEDLGYLMRTGLFRQIPLTGWSSVVVGSGSKAADFPLLLQVNTGVTGNSTANASLAARGMGRGQTYNICDFDRPLIIVADIGRAGSYVNAVHRFQLKNAVLVADMTAPGIGINILNNALWAESFGSVRGIVDLGVICNPNVINRIAMVLEPGKSIKWYVNESFVGAQTDLTKIPSGTITGNFNFSTSNPGAGGIDTYAMMTRLETWQA